MQMYWIILLLHYMYVYQYVYIQYLYYMYAHLYYAMLLALQKIFENDSFAAIFKFLFCVSLLFFSISAKQEQAFNKH